MRSYISLYLYAVSCKSMKRLIYMQFGSQPNGKIIQHFIWLLSGRARSRGVD